MSYPSSHTYETVYIIKPSVTEQDAEAIHQKVDNVIAKFEGKVMARDSWGIKELAYPIDKNSNGRYSLVVYNGKGGVVEEIERHFRILDQVIRYLTVNVPADYDYEKAKKQVQTSEEEVKRAREMRKKEKAEFMGGGMGGDRMGGDRPDRSERSERPERPSTPRE